MEKKKKPKLTDSRVIKTSKILILEYSPFLKSNWSCYLKLESDLYFLKREGTLKRKIKNNNEEDWN